MKPKPQPPKEPRYRRKPLVWEHDIDGCVCKALGLIWWVEKQGDQWCSALGRDATLDEAKARVEAEIDRRLASVLEVVELETDAPPTKP
jgi:hypothetical protein